MPSYVVIAQYVQHKIETGRLEEHDVRRLVDEEVSGALYADAMERGARRDRAPDAVKAKDRADDPAIEQLRKLAQSYR